MSRTIFITLPVADVAASAAFYRAIGFAPNPQFSNDHGACLVWSDAIAIMVAAKPLYATLTSRPIADTQATSAALFALSCDSRSAVDAITEAAIVAGGREAHAPQDEGFLYSRAFWDLDGHGFGPFWIEAAAVARGAPEIDAAIG